MRKLILVIGYVIAISICWAQNYETGNEYKGQNDYITYHAGNLPLIISVPHGGLMDPSTIPRRSCDNCITVTDYNTRALGIRLKDQLRLITGCDAHVVINELRRRKLDANREIVEAALGNVDAETAWTEYHAFLDSAKMEITRSWGRGLLIDLHGHGHELQRLELGYVLDGSELRSSDSQLDNRSLEDLSIRNLIEQTKLTLSEVLRGEHSLGELFQNSGYDAVPSKAIPYPAEDEPFYSGGYITNRYGSKDGSNIDAIQLECHRDVRLTEVELNKFADSLAIVLLEYLDLHYHMNLRSGLCRPTSIVRPADIGEVTVYPNPVCGTLNISLNTPITRTLIYNSLGQVVMERAENTEVSTYGLPNGMYTLLVESSDQYYRQQISVHCN